MLRIIALSLTIVLLYFTRSIKSEGKNDFKVILLPLNILNKMICNTISFKFISMFKVVRLLRSEIPGVDQKQ